MAPRIPRGMGVGDGLPIGMTAMGGVPIGGAVTCNAGGKGGNGVGGFPLEGEPGKGATMETLGSLSATGFEGAPGAAGAPGMPGQGGGGGGGSPKCANMNAGPSGGGGGAGGCGGAGGKGGYGGGASIAIASLGATLKLSEVALQVGAGPAGLELSGRRRAGGVGGMPGTGSGTALACAGGDGGAGAKGGTGGGGRGGHAVGIAYTRRDSPGYKRGDRDSRHGRERRRGQDGYPDGVGAAGIAAETQAFRAVHTRLCGLGSGEKSRLPCTDPRARPRASVTCIRFSPPDTFAATGGLLADRAIFTSTAEMPTPGPSIGATLRAPVFFWRTLSARVGGAPRRARRAPRGQSPVRRPQLQLNCILEF